MSSYITQEFQCLYTNGQNVEKKYKELYMILPYQPQLGLAILLRNAMVAKQKKIKPHDHFIVR